MNTGMISAIREYMPKAIYGEYKKILEESSVIIVSFLSSLNKS
jgi:hypothetical protein